MQLQLNKQELLDLGDDPRAVRIHCRSGCCWLTQAGDDRDHILRAGQSFVTTRRGKVLIMATAQTCLQLMIETPRQKSVALWQKIFNNGKRSVRIT